MNDLNNKRYFCQMLVCGLFLCACVAAIAQESADDKTDDQPAVVIQAEPSKTEEMLAEEAKHELSVGLASYYAAKFHGRRTASGEKFNSKMLTAAHLTLPFGTQLKVTNLQNMKSVIVRVNDRGPHVRGRIVDLSRAAAQAIGLTQTGTARVVLEVLPP
jgi:rare lipoprotein A